MKIETTMCHSHLVSMMIMPELMERAITDYTATSPDIQGEGFNGYMDVRATFTIRDIDAFTELWNKSYVYPSDRAEWYKFVKDNVKHCNE